MNRVILTMGLCELLWDFQQAERVLEGMPTNFVHRASGELGREVFDAVGAGKHLRVV